ncbi:uncharacterized protein L201_005507 [Kwoniella dendrophila CBS 6074]|uniref:Uncharacterized protein n=1 Tax=Kwoniella dendrophila CBS 6074 TaxID=1295534 RepID=A0AAX4JYS5_9TREE
MAPSVPIGFTPKHAQPFSLEEAMGLEVEQLVNEVKRLQNSIQHLQRTQKELKSYLDSEEGKEDLNQGENGEINKAYKENEETISSQSERITLIKLALLNKLGSDARLEHYGLSLNQDQTTKSQKSNITPTPILNGNSSSSTNSSYNSDHLDVNDLPREITQIQGGGSSGVDGNDGGLHL